MTYILDDFDVIIGPELIESCPRSTWEPCLSRALADFNTRFAESEFDVESENKEVHFSYDGGIAAWFFAVEEGPPQLLLGTPMEIRETREGVITPLCYPEQNHLLYHNWGGQ